MAPWTALEKPFKMYTIALTILSFIFIIVYGFIKNKNEKGDYCLLSRWGISKFDLSKIILYETILSFILVTIIALLGIFIGLRIGLSQNLLIKGFDYAKLVRENYLIASLLSLILVCLRHLPCLVSVKKMNI